MSPSFKYNILAWCLFVSTALATPQYFFGSTYNCVEGDGQVVYKVTSQVEETGEPVTGDYTVYGGDSLSASSTFSTGVTVTKGVDVSLAKIATLGLSYSVATSTINSRSEGVSVNCPKGSWYCALTIYPQMVRVKGTMTQKNKDIKPCKKVPQDFDVLLPVYGESGFIRARPDKCACSNFPHANDAGAPARKCGNCAAPLRPGEANGEEPTGTLPSLPSPTTEGQIPKVGVVDNDLIKPTDGVFVAAPVQTPAAPVDGNVPPA